MRTRTIGNDTVGRVEVGAIGLGLMTFDQTGTQPREQLAATVRAAVDAGVTLFDSADAYGPGQEKGAGAQGENEKLIASLLDELGVRDHVFLATKGGHTRTDGGGWDTDSSAAHLHDAVDASLQRLGVDRIALWQHHRPDPKVPYDEVIGTLKEIADSGKVARIGLSNADPDQIRSAHAVLGDTLVSVQNQFSPKGLAEKHPAFAEVAKARGISPQQVALAWELAQSPVVIPIPGAKRPQSITDSAAAADITLTDDELGALDRS